MRISIHTLGTRGDVQPFVALAKGLIDHAHTVQMAAPAQFEEFIASHGIGFVALPAEFLQLLDTAEGQKAIAESRGVLAGFKLLGRIRPLMGELLRREWEADSAFRPDMVIFHPKCFGASHIALRLGVPSILASPLPGFTPTSAFASPLAPARSLGPLNKLTHVATLSSPEWLFRKELRTFRKDVLQLPKEKSPQGAQPTLYGYSRHVVPKPADWGPEVCVSGYWFLDEPDWNMPRDLKRFLDAGPPPVYVGFGSMPADDPYLLGHAVVQALARNGQRGVLARGGGAIALRDVPESIHLIDQAPHSQLFERVCAAIHHGGAGTSGAAVRAGIPSTICAFTGDQPFWAHRLHQIGVATPALNRRSLNEDSLAEAIGRMTSQTMREQARTLQAKIEAEHGVDRAVAFIESVS